MFHLHGSSHINSQGHLEIGGCDTTELAKRFGTPLYIYDEEKIRENIRLYKVAFEQEGIPFAIAYASKAFCVQAICRLVEEEQINLDVVSSGELHTALSAGFPAERIHFHGNNKTPEEIQYALQSGIGAFVVDNFYELKLLGQLAVQEAKVVDILLRLTPGVEAHTHEYISTGQQDSKFGFDISNESAHRAILEAQKTDGVSLKGIHSHIGSQIFETEGFQLAIERMAEIFQWGITQAGATLSVLNVGGGFGIRYQEQDTPLTAGMYVKAIAESVRRSFSQLGMATPKIEIEPGRSIVGDAGTTLYTVGSIKEIPGIRTYVAVDGGMTDNPRPALYQAQYEATLANKMDEPLHDTVSIAGKCCESGDMLIWDIELPNVVSGDLLAVSCTGAYNYSMASNYNRIGRPAVVFVKHGQADIVVRRETLQDLIQYDVIPERMKTSTWVSV